MIIFNFIDHVRLNAYLHQRKVVFVTHVMGNTELMEEKRLAQINKVTTRQIGGDSKLDNKESINNTKDVDNIMVMKDVVEMEEGTFA